VTKKSPYKKSIYEVNVNPIRKGVSGWKLTKKIPGVGPQFNSSIDGQGINPSNLSMQIWPGMNTNQD
jgi:hypothetical protein